MVKRFGLATMMAVGATVLIWSTTFAALVAALDHFSPTHLLFLRWTLTSTLFIVYGTVTRMPLPAKSDLPKLALAGVLGFGLYQTLLVNGQTGVSASMAGFLVNLSPLFTTVIAVGLGRERSSAFTWLGLAACTFGLGLMAMGRGGFGAVGPSAGLIAAAALSFALYTMVTKPLLGKYSPVQVTAYTTVAGSLPFLFFARGAVESLSGAAPADVATLVYLAVLPGGISYVLWSRAVSGLTPGVAARFLYLIPVLGVPVAWIWVGDVPNVLTIAGGLATIAGVALASARPSAVQSPGSAEILSGEPLPEAA